MFYAIPIFEFTIADGLEAWWDKTYHISKASSKREAVENFKKRFKVALKRPENTGGAMKIDTERNVMASTKRKWLEFRVKKVKALELEKLSSPRTLLHSFGGY